MKRPKPRFKKIRPLPGSFRDPSGFVFVYEGILYRSVNATYEEHYQHLVKSGLCEELIARRLLLPFEEVESRKKEIGVHRYLRPKKIEFVSYPYEWCFSQLKDAAITMLEIQRTALSYGMTLKDSSAYNIQFYEGKPLLIDTLSFETYHEGHPWVAYKQFCEHFLAPLSLAAYKDPSLIQLLRVHLHGIPLELTSTLLPLRTWLRFGLCLHVHLHAQSKKRIRRLPSGTGGKFRFQSLAGLIESLMSTVQGLRMSRNSSKWEKYYGTRAETYIEEKRKTVELFMNTIKPSVVWDLGSNTGYFSRAISAKGVQVISLDSDPFCVEENYLRARKDGDKSILPLVVDLTNPSPGLGWSTEERFSVFDRGLPDAIVALAIVHHLHIGNNVSFENLAGFFSRTSRWLIIEFVPPADPEVVKMAAGRDLTYSQETFEEDFRRVFLIRDTVRLPDTNRIIYLMKARQS